MRALKCLQAETAVKNAAQAAAELDALIESQVKLDTSPLILSPIEAERKGASCDGAFKEER